MTAITAPVPGLAVALPAHYPYRFDILGHLRLIYPAAAVFVVGATLVLKPVLKSRHQRSLMAVPAKAEKARHYRAGREYSKPRGNAAPVFTLMCLGKLHAPFWSRG